MTLFAPLKKELRVQAGNVVEEGSHEKLWSNSESVYHSLVALQEAATDKNEQKMTAEDLQEIVKKDEELAEEAALEAAKEASQNGELQGGRKASVQGSRRISTQGSMKAKENSAVAAASSKRMSEKKLSGNGQEEEEDALVRFLKECEELLVLIYCRNVAHGVKWL